MVPGRNGETCRDDPLGDVLMENKVERTFLRRADFEQWGLSEGCPGCKYLRTGQGRQQAHSDACRRRIGGLLKGDRVGSARDERNNRALSDAVERHAVGSQRRLSWVPVFDNKRTVRHAGGGLKAC